MSEFTPDNNQLVYDLEQAERSLLHSRAARTGAKLLAVAAALAFSNVITGFISYDNGKEVGRVEGQQDFLKSEQKRDLDIAMCLFMADARNRNQGLYAEALLSPCIEPTPAANAAASTTKQGG